MNILDIFLPKETKKLKEINKLALCICEIISWDIDEGEQFELIAIRHALSKIETVEHKDKIDYFRSIAGTFVHRAYKKPNNEHI